MEPFDQQNIIATGFVAAARYSGNELDKKIQRNDILVDVTNTTASAFLGLTLECAQCHTHKFDPLSIRDYYRFQAFFAKAQPGNVVLASKQDTAGLVEERWRIFDAAHTRLVTTRRKQGYPEPIYVIPKTVVGSLRGEEKTRFNELERQIAKVPQAWSFYSPATASQALIVAPHPMRWPLSRDTEALKKHKTMLLLRGDVHSPGPEVTAAVPVVFEHSSPVSNSVPNESRTALADWLTSPKYPLTARVWVNRIWQWHFGKGLVETSSDFGTQGTPPTHPELLDYLATELIRNDFRTSHIHRLIVNSATWRQSSRAHSGNADVDNENRYIWRWVPRRMEAEAVRDSLLTVSGQLESIHGGPSVDGSSSRRSLYLQQRRDNLPHELELFDSATGIVSCSRRRTFAAGSCFGMTGMALQSLLANDDASPAGLQHKATAKSVIFLFMSGGPSHVDTFDEKPELNRLAGADVPDSIAKNVPRIKRAGLKNLMGSPWTFQQHGDSGLSVSELLPRTARHVDDLCVIRSMTHRNPVHGPGECVALTGTAIGDRPGLGAWSVYGLGEASQQLPSFIAMNLHTDGMQHPQAAGWGAGFLPSRFQGTVVDPLKGIRNTTMPDGLTSDQRRGETDLIQTMNRRRLESVGQHSELEARIRSYELAFQMQSAAPELFDVSTESKSVADSYGLGTPTCGTVGRACLMARRMVERGVPFIQIRVGGWDAHGNIKTNHEKMFSRTDQPVAALLDDLKRTGLLDSTLVVWGGEFGRTPTMEGRGKGRDHSPAAYSMWMAGGGVQGGQVIGRTDAIGYTVEDRPVKPQELHATILHTLGLNCHELTFDHHGLMETPVGVVGGDPIREALSI